MTLVEINMCSCLAIIITIIISNSLYHKYLDVEIICFNGSFYNQFFNRTSHLSKGSSGRKQKCTRFLTPLSGTVFHALSHGVIHFVRSVSFKNLEMEVSDWLLKNFN